MKNTYIVLGVIAVLIIIIGAILVSPYNNMVGKKQAVSESWANIQSQYQRRADLIPNLVGVVKGASNFESKTLEDIAHAEASVGGLKIDPNDLTPENLQKFQHAQGELSGALQRLMVIHYTFPDLKTTQLFGDLQAQLEGTENRINKSRDDFNATVRDYNSYIQKFPNNIVAGFTGFKEKGYFEADQGAGKAPDVDKQLNGK